MWPKYANNTRIATYSLFLKDFSCRVGAPFYNQPIDKNDLFQIVDRTEIARGPHCQENSLIEHIASAAIARRSAPFV